MINKVDLYLPNEQIDITVHNGSFLVKARSTNELGQQSPVQQEVPTATVGSFMLQGQGQISIEALQLAAQKHIELWLLNEKNQPLARMWHSHPPKMARLWRQQLQATQGAQGLALAKKWLQQELYQRQAHVQQLLTPRQGILGAKLEPLLAQLNAQLKAQQATLNAISAPQVSTAIQQQLQAVQQQSNAAYFEALHWVWQNGQETAPYPGRGQAQHLNLLDALLTHVEGKLQTLVERSLLLAGMHPYISTWQQDPQGQESLVLEFMAPYTVYAHACAMHLLLHEVKPIHYTEQKGHYALTEQGHKLLNKHWVEHIQKGHSPFKPKPAAATVPAMQIRHAAHALATTLMQASAATPKSPVA